MTGWNYFLNIFLGKFSIGFRGTANNFDHLDQGGHLAIRRAQRGDTYALRLGLHNENNCSERSLSEGKGGRGLFCFFSFFGPAYFQAGIAENNDENNAAFAQKSGEMLHVKTLFFLLSPLPFGHR